MRDELLSSHRLAVAGSQRSLPSEDRLAPLRWTMWPLTGGGGGREGVAWRRWEQEAPDWDAW